MIGDRKSGEGMRDKTLRDLNHQFFVPIQYTFLTMCLVVAGLVWWLPLTPLEHWVMVGALILGAFFILVLYQYLIPRYGLTTRINTGAFLFSTVIIAVCNLVLSRHGIEFSPVFVVIISIAGMLNKSRVTLAMIVICALANIPAHYILTMFDGPSTLLQFIFDLTIFFLAAQISSNLTNVLSSHIQKTDKKNHSMRLLINASLKLNTGNNLEDSLREIAKLIVEGVPVTWCTVSLLDTNGEFLSIYGCHPIRDNLNEPELYQKIPIHHLPQHKKALTTKESLIIHQDELNDTLTDRERTSLLFDTVSTACLIPLIANQESFGLISIGEERDWTRAEFDEEKLALIQSIAGQIAIMIKNIQLHNQSIKQTEKLTILNTLAQAVVTTIKFDELVELIFNGIKRVLPLETFFLGTLDQQKTRIEVNVLFDNGIRHPPTSIALGTGFASHVIQTRKPLLLRNVREEMHALPIQPVIMGEEKISESWLGVPMIADDEVIGIIVVASYTPNAYDESAKSLLISVVSQAALALKNARYHLEIEKQAQHDALTGALSHGYFLHRLSHDIDDPAAETRTFSLLFFDIDKFKHYNDTYGHLVGDKVLRLLVDNVHAHISPHDYIGRYGGDEFIAVLLHKTPEQAKVIAETIRTHIKKANLLDTEGNKIPIPTLSIGIASYPTHGTTSNELIIQADKALYHVKGMSRNAIHIAE